MPTSHSPDATEPHPAISTTVLVVDDYIATRALHASMLQRQGYAVLHAANGLEASTMLTRHRVDAIVLDVHMPHMDGLQFLRGMRHEHGSRRMPVVVVTAETRSTILEELSALGAHVLRKPSRPIHLVQALDGARQRASAA